MIQNPVLPSGHGEVDRTGQEGVDYQAEFDATGAEPYEPPKNEGGRQTQSFLAPVTETEELGAKAVSDKAKAARKAARDKKKFTAQAKAVLAAKAVKKAAKEKRKQEER
jgi:hypothetical protein